MAVPKRKSKVVPLEEAANLVKDGMKLAVGGMGSNNAPNAFVREIVRRGIKNLTLIPTNVTGYHADMLIGAGCVKKLYSSFVSLEHPGYAPNFRRLAEAGKLDVVDLDELGLLFALKAGAVGIPFFPMPDGMMAVDNVKTNPDWYRVINDPFTGKKVPVVPALRSDVCVIHVLKCDAYGNAQEIHNPENILHLSADKLIVTTEEIIPLEETQANYRDVTVSGYFVDAVVVAPYGAHPGECSGRYPGDKEHIREYGEAAKDISTFKKYLDEYVFKLKNHDEYMDKIGAARLSKLTYTYVK